MPERLGIRPPVQLQGLRIDNLTVGEAVELIVDSIASGRGGWVLTPNVDILRQIDADAELAALAAGAPLSLCDGMPLVWASRLQGTPLVARVAMSEMVFPLSRAAARHGLSCYLLGDRPDVARDAAAALVAHAPGLAIAGMHSPPPGFEGEPRLRDEMVADLERCSPDIVICALGFPKQERLMAELSPIFPVTWFLAAGATLSMAAGRTPPAPPWMRRAGLEWLHRLRLEPRRLAGRYLVRDVPFALRLMWVSARVGSRRR